MGVYFRVIHEGFLHFHEGVDPKRVFTAELNGDQVNSRQVVHGLVKGTFVFTVFEVVTAKCLLLC